MSQFGGSTRCQDAGASGTQGPETVVMELASPPQEHSRYFWEFDADSGQSDHTAPRKLHSVPVRKLHNVPLRHRFAASLELLHHGR
ncbi:hypothetical protein V5799_019962 [Amblyomma americanum]|uniref:Uncharacterized protein n=1 Tax=Amblyomma americanum TaxID=6943 RepID=A0AAQ4EVT5_AMBAM